MSDLDREYAILLPNGSLLTTHTGHDESTSEPSPFGAYGYLFGLPSPREPEPERVRLFPTPQAAQQIANKMRAEARKVGVDDLCVRVVGRVCGPWMTPNEGEQLTREILDYIAGEPS